MRTPYLRHMAQLLLLVASIISTTISAEQPGNAWQLTAFKLPDIAGQERSLSDWKGDVILLNFWATWCLPCRNEIPRLIELQKKYEQEGFSIISIGLDEARRLQAYTRQAKINYPVLIADPQNDRHLLGTWGNPQSVLPFSVVIGRDGQLHYSVAGEFKQEAFDTYVLPLLQKVRRP